MLRFAIGLALLAFASADTGAQVDAGTPTPEPTTTTPIPFVAPCKACAQTFAAKGGCHAQEQGDAAKVAALTPEGCGHCADKTGVYCRTKKMESDIAMAGTPCEDGILSETPLGKDLTCAGIVAMHACNHPEYGEILSAQCKKSCGRCGDGCATATGSTAHGRGGGDDDVDTDDDDSAGSRKIDENNLDLSDKDVKRCLDQTPGACEWLKSYGACVQEPTKHLWNDYANANCKTTCEYGKKTCKVKGAPDTCAWLNPATQKEGQTCKDVTWELEPEKLYDPTLYDYKWSEAIPGMQIQECPHVVYYGCKGGMTLKEAQDYCKNVNTRAKQENENAPHPDPGHVGRDADDFEPYQCTGVTCKGLDSDCSVGAAYEARYTDNGFKGHAISAHLGNDLAPNRVKVLDDNNMPVMRPQCCHQVAGNVTYATKDTAMCQCYEFPKFRKAKLTWGSEKGAAYTFVEKHKDRNATAVWSACTAACEKSASRTLAEGSQDAQGAGWYGTEWYAGGQAFDERTNWAPDCKGIAKINATHNTSGDGGCKIPFPDP